MVTDLVLVQIKKGSARGLGHPPSGLSLQAGQATDLRGSADGRLHRLAGTPPAPEGQRRTMIKAVNW
jgi:hypothetical protein